MARIPSPVSTSAVTSFYLWQTSSFPIFPWIIYPPPVGRTSFRANNLPCCLCAKRKRPIDSHSHCYDPQVSFSFDVTKRLWSYIPLCSCLRLERCSFHTNRFVNLVVDLSRKERHVMRSWFRLYPVIDVETFEESALISKEIEYRVFPFDERFFCVKLDKRRYVDIYIYIYETIIFRSIILSTIVWRSFSSFFSSILGNVIWSKRNISNVAHVLVTR